MRRKLVKQGQNALTVTVPAKWTKLHHLEAGDEVEIKEEENNLIVYSLGKTATKSKTLNIENLSIAEIRSVIASAYKSGYTEIELKFKTVPKANLVEKTVNNFTGLEIISQSKTSITIKSYLTIEPEDIKNLIIKMFQSVKVSAETIVDEWNQIDLKYFKSTVMNLRKLRDHCLRTINVSKYGGDLTYDYYDLVTVLEKMMTDLSHLAEYIVQFKPKKKKLIKEIVNFTDDFYKCFLKKDFKISEQVWNKHSKERKELVSPKNIQKEIKKDPLIIFYYSLMERLQHLSSRILSLSSS